MVLTMIYCKKAHRHLPMSFLLGFQRLLGGFRNCFEVDLHNTAGGACVSTFAAADTLFIIDGGTVVHDFDGVSGTDFFALFASDTAMSASFAGIDAFILVAASNNDLNRSGHDLNLLVRTGFGTNTAADA